MKKEMFLSALLLTIAINLLHAQIQLPWSVIDRGGGKSSANGVALQSSVGQSAVQAASAGGLMLEGGFIPGVRALSGTTTTLDLTIEDGWNMVSVPLLVSDYRKTALYPTALSSAFAYQGSYGQRDTLKNGEGYWVKYALAATTHLSGTSFAQETITVANKWNMIGGVSYSVLVTDITPIAPTTVASNYFGYSHSSGYFMEDTLKPGKAYWVKVNSAGKLVLQSGSVLIEPSSSSLLVKQSHKLSITNSGKNIFSSLQITDARGQNRILYFSTVLPDIDLNRYELPPVAPGEALDVRYSTGRMMETADENKVKEIAIHVSSAVYPISIGWKLVDEDKEAKLLISGKEILIKGTGTAPISNFQSSIRLRLLPSSSRELPKEFALQQNYPNPFNPSTTIRYQLPAQSWVRLKVYNMLGQEVVTLIDALENAGYKSVDWNSMNIARNLLASGVYYYKIDARSVVEPRETFTQVKRMLLLK